MRGSLVSIAIAMAVPIASVSVAALAFAADAPVAPLAAPAPRSDVAITEAAHHGRLTLLDRPHTVAELELGIIALPNAPISAANRGGSTFLGNFGNGDATAQTGVHLLYRASREWAIGAGAIFAPRPTSDYNYGAGASGLQRTHARSYLFMGGEVRYYPLRTRWFEGWFGLTGGGIIIADRFTTNDAPQVPSILGTGTVTVSTEGLAIGLQAGADYMLSDAWVIGLTVRADQWFLPAQGQAPFFQTSSPCDAIGDCATLAGSVRAIEVGVTVGYRIPL
jgi:hypothetical protein